MTINNIKQGDKFIYNSIVYMKLPAFVECYDNKSNAIDMTKYIDKENNAAE